MNTKKLLTGILIISMQLMYLNCYDIVTKNKEEKSGVNGPTFYTSKEPGIWEDKAASHIPHIEFMSSNRIKAAVPLQFTDNPRHYIEVISLMKGDKEIAVKKFKPGDKEAAAIFELPGSGNEYWILSKCNLHDMWKEEVKSSK